MSFKENIQAHFRRNRGMYEFAGMMAVTAGAITLVTFPERNLRTKEMESREKVAGLNYETAKMQFCGGCGLSELEAPSL